MEVARKKYGEILKIAFSYIRAQIKVWYLFWSLSKKEKFFTARANFFLIHDVLFLRAVSQSYLDFTPESFVFLITSACINNYTPVSSSGTQVFARLRIQSLERQCLIFNRDLLQRERRLQKTSERLVTFSARTREIKRTDD